MYPLEAADAASRPSTSVRRRARVACTTQSGCCKPLQRICLRAPCVGRPSSRHHMHSWQLRTLCVAILCGWAGARGAELSEEDELAMAYGDKSFVSIATGAKVPVA